MADLTDETNIARGFSLLLMTWVLGYVIGLSVLAYGPLLFAHFSGPIAL
jgi:hypothetical protein